jgi:spermidine synthase
MNRVRTVPSASLPSWAFPFILLLFFLSGASGLVYEVIWTRVLLTVFGATLYAISTVLAAFMAGLALGSWLGGRLADRLHHPFRAYGILEILVAVTALLVSPALDLFDPLYRAIYAGGSASFFQLSLIRFGVSFLILLIPTSCMGATLPLLARFAVQRDSGLGGRIGALYATNTTGAVTGTFLAGFVLLANLGVSVTILVAAGVSAFVGILALLGSRRLEHVLTIEARGTSQSSVAQNPPPLESPAAPQWLARLILVSYGISGFVALAYQVFWTRALVFRFEILKNTTYSFSAMLTVFLIGLAVGSAVMSSVVNRQKDPVRLYGLLQLLTGVGGVLSLVMILRVVGGIQVGESIRGGEFFWIIGVANVFARTAVAILLPTFLMGALFPVVARICISSRKQVGSGTGRLYAVNTVGAILGAFAAGFLLIPVFGLAYGLIALAFVNITIAAVVLILNQAETRQSRMVWVGLVIAVVLLVVRSSPGPAPFQDVKELHKIVTDEFGELAYIEGPLATASVVEDSIGNRTIFVDNASVAGTDRILLTDQKSLAHVPMLLLEEPKTALTVGFGSGGASWSFLQYDELERVDCIEICPTVPRLAHTLRDSNHGLLDGWDRITPLPKTDLYDGRLRIIFDDARSFLRFSGEKYDVIATDCTDLRYKSNANLYDVEYFELCQRAITDDGMVVVWMPLGGMSPEVFSTALRTFSHVFPDMSIWFMNNEPTHYLLLLGGKYPLRISLATMKDRIARPAIRADLEEISLQQPEKILSCFLTDAAAVESRLRALNTALNTENMPVLEFQSPKYGIADKPLLENLEILRRHQLPVQPLIDDLHEFPDSAALLGRLSVATPLILDGHAQLRRLDLRAAARSYVAAQKACPDDESLPALLRFDDLKRRLARNPNDIWPLVTLAEIELEKGNLALASRMFLHARSLTAAASDPLGSSVFDRATLGFAEYLLATGQTDKALQYVEANQERLSSNPAYHQFLASLFEHGSTVD